MVPFQIPILSVLDILTGTQIFGWDILPLEIIVRKLHFTQYINNEEILLPVVHTRNKFPTSEAVRETC